MPVAGARSLMAIFIIDLFQLGDKRRVNNLLLLIILILKLVNRMNDKNQSAQVIHYPEKINKNESG